MLNRENRTCDKQPFMLAPNLMNYSFIYKRKYKSELEMARILNKNCFTN